MHGKSFIEQVVIESQFSTKRDKQKRRLELSRLKTRDEKKRIRQDIRQVAWNCGYKKSSEPWQLLGRRDQDHLGWDLREAKTNSVRLLDVDGPAVGRYKSLKFVWENKELIVNYHETENNVWMEAKDKRHALREDKVPTPRSERKCYFK